MEQGVGKIIGELVRKPRGTLFFGNFASKIVSPWTSRGGERWDVDINGHSTDVDGNDNGPLTCNSNVANLIYIQH